MITTLGLLWQGSGLNKLLPYILLGMAICAIFVVVYWQGRTAGTDSAKTKQLQDSLKRYANDAQRKADIESLSSTVARHRLRQRWGLN